MAIVGANGAGKSTLIKLLCRLYDPQEGEIEVDDINIRDVSVDELREHIGVLFQMPIPYHATVAQNITMGKLRGVDNLRFEFQKLEQIFYEQAVGISLPNVTH